MTDWQCISRMIIIVAAMALPARFAQSQQPLIEVFPEQRSVHVRGPEQLRSAALPDAPQPFTIATETDNRIPEKLSLDEAIHLALQNADVIRVLTGVAASSSGRTVYDVAISNAGIDQATSEFDPTFSVNSNMGKIDRPGATFDFPDLTRSVFQGSSTDSINTTVGLSKKKLNGGTVGFDATAIGSYFEPGVVPLEPEYRSSAEFSLRQPLLRGFGRAVNLAPVVISRINTERSYFQFKDSVQELVRGVIAAYWNLVFARVDVWARSQQVDQSEFAYELALARQKAGMARAADVAQARSALANFRASMITARANLLLSETALRNILGMPPSSTQVIVPTSLPVLEQIEFDWNEIVSISETYRPDIIELKLILEADQQLLLQANNSAQPQLDGVANYRWDGLSGQMPDGTTLRNQPGRFAGFNVGVNFSVPLGLRQGRASLRRQELILARDQANLDQGVHQMVHQLTINYRNLDQFFGQYVAFKEARQAARVNFENQISEFTKGRRDFLNTLQAITDWGNAVSQEARSITQYNTELANVERQSGTILETHGIRFIEERYGSLGPQGLMGIRQSSACYPKQIQIEGATNRYVQSAETSDESFNLEDLDVQGRKSREQEPDLNSRPEIEAPRPEFETNPADQTPTVKPAVRPEVGQNLTPRMGLITNPTQWKQKSQASDRVSQRRPRLRNPFR